jgi:ATP-dependent Clp protease adaptor protein ClpS
MSSLHWSLTATEAPAPARHTRPVARTRPKFEPLYNVVLIDDDQHTYQYVIEMLCALFAHSVEMAFMMAREVDTQGRVIVDTTHRERAELKRDEIKSFGADPLLPGSTGSMHAVIEPAVSQN